MSMICPKSECKAQKGLCGCEKKLGITILIAASVVILGKALGWF